jgi:pSer/pThr/pTyr-binding forkhead associated (FHA) protein
MTINPTRKIDKQAAADPADGFLKNNRATLVIVSGDAAGVEHSLDRSMVTVGRGPEADLSFADDAMSRTHAAFELAEDGFRVRDLGSTNGVLVNGSRTQCAELKHGDRVMLGRLIFTYLLEERRPEARTYILPEI